MGKTARWIGPMLMLLAARSASAEPGHWYFAFEGHAATLSDAPNRSMLAPTFGYGLTSGYRRGAWGLFLHAEQDLWDDAAGVQSGALNIGLGGDHACAGGFVHTSIAAGPSILLFRSLLDQPGSMGLFVDMRPVGLRWRAAGHTIGFDPLSFAFVAPALDGIPLVRGEYRTILSVEL